MTSIAVTKQGPSLEGKVAVVTGASSGIGLATAKVLSERGARVLNLDPNSPPTDANLSSLVTWQKTDQSSWSSLLAAFNTLDRVDIIVANGGITEVPNYFEDAFDEQGNLLPSPADRMIDINLRGTLQFLKIGISRMRQQGTGGSVVIVTSATAYLPECGLPVYAGCKAALAGLVRALRVTMPAHGITVNSVAPSATITAQIPKHLLGPIQQLGLPVSDPEYVAWAIYYSATASQDKRVENYGIDQGTGAGRWNGRTIVTLGETWTEVEEPLADCKKVWWGPTNFELTNRQQAITDPRQVMNGKA